MAITKENFALWEIFKPKENSTSIQISDNIITLEKSLQVSLPKEYKEFLHLIHDRGCVPLEGVDNFLAKYNGYTCPIINDAMLRTNLVIEYTQLLQESIYDHRSLLPNGLIAIGCNYDGDGDGDGDAYVIYDARPDSATYQHLFHWRYYRDNLVVGEGLGLLARSLKEFLHMPVPQDKI